jgi:hypothetical protein
VIVTNRHPPDQSLPIPADAELGVTRRCILNYSAHHDVSFTIHSMVAECCPVFETVDTN